MRKLLVVVLAVLFASEAFGQDAPSFMASGFRDEQARKLADSFAVSYGTVAAAGSTYEDATAISKRQTYVTASDNAKGVKLPTATLGFNFDIYNTVASKNLLIYPPTGGTINGGSANVSIGLYGKGAMRCLLHGTLTYTCGGLSQPGTRTIFIPAATGNVGTHTSGSVDWVLSSAKGFATLAASATGASMQIPISGLQIGDTIVSYKVVGQFENTADDAGTIFDADLRVVTNAAAGGSDASIGAITQVAPDADVAITSSKTLATAEVLASGEFPYLLVKATTGASSGVELGGVEVTVYRDN